MSLLNRNSFGDLCRQIVVGFVERDVRECRNFSTLEATVAKCDVYDIDSGYHWLRLIQSFTVRPKICSNRSMFRYQLFPGGNAIGILEMLHTGSVDLYPVPLLAPESGTNAVTYAKQFFSLNYYFYAKLDDNSNNYASTTDAFFDASFVSSPFQRTVWCYVAVSVLIVSILQILIDDLRRKRAQGALRYDRFYAIGLSLPMALICAAYSSSLKSIVIDPTRYGPFRSLLELTDRLRRNELQLILENNESTRYRAMTEREYARRDELIYLQSELHRSPTALRVVDRMEDACRLLNSSTKFVFVGYDELVYGSCKHICFWKFELKLDNETYFMYYLPRNSSVYRPANMAAYALPNYLNVLNRRRARKVCDLPSNQKRIRVGTLLYAFGFIVVIWSITSIILVFELIYFFILKIYYSRRTCFYECYNQSIPPETEEISL